LVLHACPQPPQLFGSVAVLTQVPLVPSAAHRVSMPQFVPQVGFAPWQVALPPRGAGHSMQLEPHELVDVELFGTHVPPQSWKPTGQTHVPSLHPIPPVQACPHVLQLFGSLENVTQARLAPLPQGLSPLGQMQVPP
jgi:hypothetical protein